MNPKDCLSFKTKQFDRVLARQYDSGLASSGIKVTQFSLLTHIKNYGPIALTDLAAKMEIESSTMTRNIQVLKKNGWIKLSIGNDARSRLVIITKKGLLIQEKATLLWERQQKQIIKKLGRKRLTTLSLLLDESMKLVSTSAITLGKNNEP